MISIFIVDLRNVFICYMLPYYSSLSSSELFIVESKLTTSYSKGVVIW